MKRLFLMAFAAALCAGPAMAQSIALDPEVLRQAAPVQPDKITMSGGFVLDSGAPVAPDRDNVVLTNVPRGSRWTADIPVTMTVEGVQSLTVTCELVTTIVIPLSLAAPQPPTLNVAVEHTFTVDGPFLGRVVMGFPLLTPVNANAGAAECRLVARGVRNGVDWRALEFTFGGGSTVQFVLEANDTRYWTGHPFNRQVVLSTLASAIGTE